MQILYQNSERGIIHTVLSKVLQQRDFSQGKGKKIIYSLKAFNSNNNNNNNATNNEGSSGNNNNNSSKGTSDNDEGLVVG